MAGQLIESRADLLLLKGSVLQEIKKDSARATAWDGVPEIIDARIDEIDSALALYNGHQEETT